MLNELSEKFNKEIENIKMVLENKKKDYSEMKNTLQQVNSGLDEVMISSEIWKIRKQKTPNQNREGKE